MINAYVKKQERSQIKNLILYLKEPEKEQTKFKVNRRKEITKIRRQINERGNRETLEKISKTGARFFYFCFFEK